MVDENLLSACRSILGTRPRRILVTGGTGFVGSHLARCLAECGHEVTAAGRNRYRTHRIIHPKIRFLRLDICDASAVAAACAAQELVFHCAAKSSPWGPPDSFQQINVDGTRNVVAGCNTHRVQRLVLVSSTSIFFDFTDLHNHQDDDAYADPQACNYSDSKRQSEQIVFRAAADGLNAFTIRARAVFGPGDTSLLPRLIEAARDGRLRQIGDGENVVDLTYIDNLVLALVLAADRGQAGGVCTITNGQPVKLWDLLREIFPAFEIPFRDKPVSYATANAFTAASELLHRSCRLLGEPKLTRYTLGLLAKHQVFDQTAARTELDYKPLVSVEHGIERTLARLKQQNPTHATTDVKLHCFTTGYASGNRRIVERTAPNQHTRFHAMAALIAHPTMGLTLFDTGNAPRMSRLPGMPAWVYKKALTTYASDALTIASQLRHLGIDPNDIERIVISHFHPDHIAGLRDFPNAEFIASRTAWNAIRNQRGFRALSSAVLPGLLPDDFAKRLHLIETFDDPGMGPFESCHDLFGDGSLRLFDLPGHAAGQMGALVQSGPRTRDFLVADAAWTSSAIRDNTMPHLLTSLFVHSRAQIRHTLDQLHSLQQQFPEIHLVPTHCPEVASHFDFDAQLENCKPAE